MVTSTSAACYFCSEGEQAIEVLEASLFQSAASGSSSAPRLERRLRALRHTLSAHHCTGR
ncbi:MAG: hypothetical protein R3C39_10005 [Dehalococcoidia bacterium]